MFYDSVARILLTVRTNSALPPTSPSHNEGLLEVLDNPGPLTGAGWTGVKENTDVTDFVVTAENLNLDLTGILVAKFAVSVTPNPVNYITSSDEDQITAYQRILWSQWKTSIST